MRQVLEDMQDIIDKLYLKNRTIVSADVSDCMDSLSSRYPLEIHRYPTGSEYQTWPIPPEWNVHKAVLKCGDEVIASYAESPLFLAPYSQAFCGIVSREELVEHSFTNPQHPDAFCYEFRLAYNYQRRLNEWRISLPHNRLLSLPEGPFHVEIDVDVVPGDMLIGELAHPGESGHWFTFLSHYCHIGQINDGLAGVAIMLETLERIKKAHPHPKHGYKALLLPETIGVVFMRRPMRKNLIKL